MTMSSILPTLIVPDLLSSRLMWQIEEDKKERHFGRYDISTADIRAIALSNEGIMPPDPKIIADRAIPGLYDALQLTIATFAQGENHVEIFPYDFRHDVRAHSTRLRETVMRLAALSPEHTVNIVSHGLGGLLVRYVFSGPGNVHGKLHRWVALAPYFRGWSGALDGILYGTSQLDLFDARINSEDVRSLFLTWPSVYQLFPIIHGILDPGNWPKTSEFMVDCLKCAADLRKDLDEGNETLQKISSQIYAILGIGIPTLSIQKGETNLVKDYQRTWVDGDGLVDYQRGWLSGIHGYCFHSKEFTYCIEPPSRCVLNVNSLHYRLLFINRIHRAIAEILCVGETERLQSVDPPENIRDTIRR